MSGTVPSAPTADAALQHTPLHALHLELGARMVPFAGYAMPVQYPSGLIAEHKHCRTQAALFDVSHMGQVSVRAGELSDAAHALESLIPIDILGLAPGQQRYGYFTDAAGGLLDDLMVARRGHDLLVVVNAACKAADLKHLQTHIGHRCAVTLLDDRALLALQGPQAVTALARLAPGVAALAFMRGDHFTLAGAETWITRSGYTGEDGFEISVPAAQAEALARALLAQPEVAPAGLGARDTLRLEAGLPLYGHDIGTNTTPAEAALGWAIQKVRRPGGARAGGYPGADHVGAQLAQGASSKRIGLVGLERVPVREGAEIVDARGHRLGHVTSGTLAPTVDKPIAMAVLPANHTAPSAEVYAVVRGKRLPMRVTALPFVPRRYVRD